MREINLDQYAKAAGAPRSQAIVSATAVNLFRGANPIDLQEPAVLRQGLGLEQLIPALLAISRENGFIKFDPWDPQIRIKQFPRSWVCCQYNPQRDARNRHATGQKPSPSQKKTDFLDWETFPENERYLVWTSSAGRRYGILVQPVPIVPGHLIVSSLDRDPQTHNHFPQRMTPEFIIDSQELSADLAPLGYVLAYNDWGAGASVNHFHTQAVPAVYLPLIALFNRCQLGRPQRVKKYPEVQVTWLEPFVHGWGSRFQRWLRMPFYPGLAVALEARELDQFTGCQHILQQWVVQHQVAFNRVTWKKASGSWVDVFFPRGAEAVWSGALKAGYVEMCGLMIIPDSGLYASIQRAGQIEEALAQAGISRLKQQKAIQDLRLALVAEPVN